MYPTRGAGVRIKPAGLGGCGAPSLWAAEWGGDTDRNGEKLSPREADRERRWAGWAQMEISSLLLLLLLLWKEELTSTAAAAAAAAVIRYGQAGQWLLTSTFKMNCESNNSSLFLTWPLCLLPQLRHVNTRRRLFSISINLRALVPRFSSKRNNSSNQPQPHKEWAMIQL